MDSQKNVMTAEENDEDNVGGSSLLEKISGSRLSFIVLAFMFGIHNFISYYSSINYDDYFNLTIGRYLVNVHSFPMVDQFTWLGVEKNLGMVAYQWLYNIGLYMSYVNWGWWPLRIAVAISTGISAWLIFRIIQERTKSNSLALMLGTIIFTLVAVNETLAFQLRPQSLIMPILLLEVLLLEKKHGIWWIIPLNILAFNIHAGIWPIFIIIAFLYLLKDKKLWPLFLAAAITVFVTPYPIGNFTLPFEFFYYRSSFTFVGEWKNLFEVKEFWRPINIAVIGYLLVYLMAFYQVIANIRKEKNLTSVYLLLVLLMFSTSVRYISFMALFLIPYLAIYLHDFFALEKKGKLMVKLQFLIFVALLLVSAVGIYHDVKTIPKKSEEVQLNLLSQNMLEYMKNNGVKRVFNYNYGLGGQMEYYGITPMYDNRTMLYLPTRNPERFNYAAELNVLENNPEQVRYLTKKYHTDYVILARTAVVEDWKVFSRDEADKAFVDDKNILFHLKPEFFRE